jgi:hypothetical protein
MKLDRKIDLILEKKKLNELINDKKKIKKIETHRMI